MNAITDAELIERSLSHGADFALIFDRHASQVHGYMARRAGHQVADELLGEVFRAAFEQRHRYDMNRAEALPWLYGISKNMLRRSSREGWRRTRALNRLGSRSVVGASDDPAELSNSIGRQPRIAAALGRLSSGERDVVLLHTWEELGYEEIALALQIPVGTVRSRLHRARKRLRSDLWDLVDRDCDDRRLADG